MKRKVIIANLVLATLVSTPCFPTLGSESHAGQIAYKTVFHIRPPFYKGQMPLVIISRENFIGPNDMIVVEQEFPSWIVKYKYRDPALMFSGIPASAVAVDANGKTLATANFDGIKKGEGLFIEENHADGRFKAKSFISFSSGFKEREISSTGDKVRDYFILWPVSTTPGGG